jgi:hypothetical protein
VLLASHSPLRAGSWTGRTPTPGCLGSGHRGRRAYRPAAALPDRSIDAPPVLPTFLPIHLLHPPGDPDHSISFARKVWMEQGWPVDAAGRRVHGSAAQIAEMHPPDWIFEPLWNVYARDLHEVFPQIAEQLVRDSLFGLNGVIVPRRVLREADPTTRTPKKLGPYRPSDTRVVVGGQARHLPRATRKASYVRGLTACWADLDFYKVELTEDAVVGALHGMQQRRELPAASIVLFSGRGLWLLWLLRDAEHPDCAVRAGAENVRVWQRVQRAIHRKLAAFGSDAAAIDVVHMARVPGSVRTDLGDEPVPIGWQVQGPPGQLEPFRYTLPALADAFNVPDVGAPQAVVRALEGDPARRIAKQRGARGRYYKLLQQLDWLEQIRGGWRIGTRGRAIWLQVASMVSIRKMCRRMDDLEHQPVEMQRIGQLSNDELLNWAVAIALRCEQGEGFSPRSEAANAWRRATADGGLGNEATRGLPPSYRTISEWLSVTPAETEQLRALGFANPLPPAEDLWKGEARGPVLVRGRAAEASARRQALGELLANVSAWPTLRRLAERLRERGHSASVRTILLDLRALGIENPLGLAARARARGIHTLPFGAA